METMGHNFARISVILAILAIAQAALISREDENDSDRALTLRKKYT